MARVFYWIWRRDLRLALRNKTDLISPLMFFIVTASLFPLGTGAERELLQALGPGVIWVAALLAALLGLDRMFDGDYGDGTLEQMLLSVEPLTVIVAAKMAAHWTITGLPLALVSPLLGLQYGMPVSAWPVIVLSIALGSVTLSALGAAGAGLALGLRGRNVLVPVLVLPLCVPVLVFGAASAGAAAVGGSAAAPLMLLAAMALAAVAVLPYLTALALRIAMD